MPKQIKKRVTKSPETKEAKARGMYDKILDFLKAKRKNLTVIGFLAGAVIVLYFVSVFHNNSLRQDAYSLELEGYNYYYGINLNDSITEAERWGKALELFREAVKIKPATTSIFYLGNCYYKLGDFSNAIKEYNVFVKEFEDDEEILPVVYQKLAAAYIKTGQEKEALSTLGKLAGVGGGVFKDTALILEARYYEGLGKPEKGMEKYRELATQFPASPWVSEARSRIDMEEFRKSEKMKNEEGKGEKVPLETEKK